MYGSIYMLGISLFDVAKALSLGAPYPWTSSLPSLQTKWPEAVGGREVSPLGPHEDHKRITQLSIIFPTQKPETTGAAKKSPEEIHTHNTRRVKTASNLVHIPWIIISTQVNLPQNHLGILPQTMCTPNNLLLFFEAFLCSWKVFDLIPESMLLVCGTWNTAIYMSLCMKDMVQTVQWYIYTRVIESACFKTSQISNTKIPNSLHNPKRLAISKDWNSKEPAGGKVFGNFDCRDGLFHQLKNAKTITN